MKSGLAIVTDVYAALVASPVNGAISGDIYKDERPANSSKEDVVISCLAATSEQLQRAVINVNVHVPAIVVNTGEATENRPDNARMEELTDMIHAALNDVWIDDYSMHIEQPGLLIKEQETNNYYVNIRIGFYYVNL